VDRRRLPRTARRGLRAVRQRAGSRAQKVSLSQARPEDLISLTGLTGEPIRYFKVPHTSAAIRIPQAQVPLVGFDVGRSSERVIRAAAEGEGFKSGFTLDLSFLSRRKKKQKSEEPLFQGPQPFIGRDLAYMSLPEWRIAYRGRAQKELIEQVIAGPLTELLAADPPLGYRITVRVRGAGRDPTALLKQDDELAAFTERTSWLAARLREICLANASPQPFEDPRRGTAPGRGDLARSQFRTDPDLNCQ
jgi:hypothetical protein